MISVVVPCRNAGRYIGPLLESLVSQDVEEPAEIIVIDNGSTDGSRKVAERVSGRIPIRVFDLPHPANASRARNFGVKLASGDKLFLVDADDEVAPGYLAAMSAALENHEFVTSRVDCDTLNPEWVRGAHGPPWQAEEIIPFYSFLPGSGPNIAIRRELYEKVGGFPEDFSGSQDIAFSWRVQLNGAELYLVKDALYRYRYRNTLRGLFRQTFNWGRSNVLLYRYFREAGMPARSLREVVGEWGWMIIALARARSKTQFAPIIVRFGSCSGRLIGSVRYRRLYL